MNWGAKEEDSRDLGGFVRSDLFVLNTGSIPSSSFIFISLCTFVTYDFRVHLLPSLLPLRQTLRHINDRLLRRDGSPVKRGPRPRRIDDVLFGVGRARDSSDGLGELGEEGLVLGSVEDVEERLV